MIQQASEDKKKAEDKSEDLSKKAVAYYKQLLDKNKEPGLTFDLALKDRLNYFDKSVPEKEELFVTCVKKREAEKSMRKANIRYDALNKKLKEFTSQDY